MNVKVKSSSVAFNYTSDKNITAVKNKLVTIGYPIEGEKNSVVSKAKSYISCATGKMSG